MIFVDSNILIDVIAPGQEWREWSLERIEQLGAQESMVIDTVVLAELASGFPTLGEAVTLLSRLGLEVRALGEEAAFLGGLAFKAYRQAGRDRSSMLADFLIGGHASYLGARLLTRNAAIYRRFFPNLILITPETHP